MSGNVYRMQINELVAAAEAALTENKLITTVKRLRQAVSAVKQSIEDKSPSTLRLSL